MITEVITTKEAIMVEIIPRGTVEMNFSVEEVDIEEEEEGLTDKTIMSINKICITPKNTTNVIIITNTSRKDKNTKSKCHNSNRNINLDSRESISQLLKYPTLQYQLVKRTRLVNEKI